MSRVLRVANVSRMALFPVAYGLSGALIGGTLNRIMIAELELPASLVGVFFAIPLLISPLRVWLGYTSDAYPVFGRRREPYIIAGGLLVGLGIVLVSLLAVRTVGNPAGLVLGVGASFVVYGVGRNLGLNTFQALVSDTFGGTARQRAITFYEVATLLGMVVGAGFLGKALADYDPGRLVAVALGVALVVLVLTLAAAAFQERPGAGGAVAATARKLPFGQVLRDYVLADRQVRLYFIVVFLTFVGTLAQDVLLEPYGALVLGMTVGQTTRLTMFWGLGVLFSMLLSGAFLLKRIDFLKLMRAGIAVSAVVFVGVIVVGFAGSTGAFQAVVALMGLATGIAGAGMLAGVVTFTTKQRAGMLMGVWGVANMAGHAFGSVLGGSIVDVVRALTGDALLAYSAVFAFEIVVLVTAWVLTFRLDFGSSRVFQDDRESALAVS